MRGLCVRASLCVVVLSTLLVAASASAQSLISATYGSGDRRADVRSRLQSFVQGGKLFVRVNNQSMGIDPAPGRAKDLRIQARDRGGEVRDYMFREGEMVSLELEARADGGRGYRDDDDQRDRDWDRRDRDGLIIMRAFYGINNQTAEVTGHLQDLVRNNSLFIRVNNETLGVDPAHEHGKVLCVFYRYRGEPRAAIVRETDELRIP